MNCHLCAHSLSEAHKQQLFLCIAGYSDREFIVWSGGIYAVTAREDIHKEHVFSSVCDLMGFCIGCCSWHLSHSFPARDFGWAVPNPRGPHQGNKNNVGSHCWYLSVTIIFNLRTAAFKAYCAIWVRCSNFCHQASPRMSPCESTQRQKVELWARNVREFCLNSEFTLHLGIFYMP
jgi:hypothetical protein